MPNLRSHQKVRAGKVVLEVGGLAEWAEVSTFSALKAWLAHPKYLLQVRPWLSTVAHQLPFHAIAVHSEQLDKIREEEVGSGKGIPNISQSDSLSKHSLLYRQG